MGVRGMALSVLLLLAGCEGDERGAEPEICHSVVEPAVRMDVTLLAWGQEDPMGIDGVVPGIDVDGRASNDDDARGCFWQDAKWPADAEVADVDNQLGPLVAMFSATVDADGDYALAIASGALRISLELGPADLALSCARSVTWVDGDTRVPTTLVASDEHTIEVSFSDRLLFPVFVDDRRVLGILQTARLRVDLSNPRIPTAVIGGAVSVPEANRVGLELADSPDPGYADLIRNLVDTSADLAPDTAGTCQGISSGWLMRGTLTELTP